MGSELLVFNEAALAELIELEASGEEGLVRSLIEDYFVSSRELMTALTAALDLGDKGVMERSAHSLKSSSQLLGLEILAAHAFELESGLRDGQIDTLKISQTPGLLENAHAALKHFLAR